MALDQPLAPADERLDTIRGLVVEAGVEILERDGLQLRSSSITYARVFAFLEEEFGIRLSRGSVHGRIWASQDDFRTDVLSAAARHTSPYEHSTRMHDAIVAILTDLDRRHVSRRERVLTFSRIAGHALLLGYLESSGFRQFQAIKAMARTVDDPDTASILRTLVRENADGNREERIARFGFAFDGLGLRPRPELELGRDDAVDLFMTLTQILVTGAHLDHHAGFEAMASTVATDLPASDDWPWTYMGFGFLAAVDAVFEDDPDAAVPPPGGYPSAEELGPLTDGSTKPPDLASLVGDRPRRSREELRDLVIAAGVQVFLRDGLRLEAGSLTYASVFAHLKRTRGIVVHRSTVHQRIWSSQDEFRAEVLAETAHSGTTESMTAIHQAMAAQAVSRHPDGAVNHRQLILDNTLATASAQMEVATSSPTFNRWQLVKATLLARPPGPHADLLQAAVERRYEDMLTVFSDTYRAVLPLVGLEVNPELGIDEDQAYHLFAAICATLSTGADYNISAGAQLACREFSLASADGSGRRQSWPVPAIGALAVLDLLFVPTQALGRA